VTGKAFGCFHG